MESGEYTFASTRSPTFSNGRHWLELEGNYLIWAPEEDKKHPFVIYWRDGFWSRYSPHLLPASKIVKEAQVKGVTEYWMAEVALRNCVKCGVRQGTQKKGNN